MESNSGPSVREASTLTIKPRGILINVGSIALYMTCYFTRRSLGTKVEPNMAFAAQMKNYVSGFFSKHTAKCQ